MLVSIKPLTMFQRANCLSLMRLKPVVRTLPSDRKIALMGRAPSCAFSFSCEIYFTDLCDCLLTNYNNQNEFCAPLL